MQWPKIICVSSRAVFLCLCTVLVGFFLFVNYFIVYFFGEFTPICLFGVSTHHQSTHDHNMMKHFDKFPKSLMELALTAVILFVSVLLLGFIIVEWFDFAEKTKKVCVHNIAVVQHNFEWFFVAGVDANLQNWKLSIIWNFAVVFLIYHIYIMFCDSIACEHTHTISTHAHTHAHFERALHVHTHTLSRHTRTHRCAHTRTCACVLCNYIGIVFAHARHSLFLFACKLEIKTFQLTSSSRVKHAANCPCTYT